MGMASVDEMLAAELFVQTRTATKAASKAVQVAPGPPAVKIPVLFNETLLFLMSWAALNYLRIDVGLVKNKKY